ncbi:LapA family protein [Afipia sp. TerB]
MRKFLNTLIVLPLALIFIAFAVANRHFVTLSFDPFNSADPAVALTLPLFVVVIAMAALGVIAGGIATWFGQRRWRRSARQLEGELQETRSRLVTAETSLAHLRASQTAGEHAVSGQIPYLMGIGRDKHGAPL